MNIIQTSLLLTIIATLLQCGSNAISLPGGEGNGSETTARGIIVDTTGAPASGVFVQLLPAAYNPVMHDTLSPQWCALSDSNGAYRLENVPAGRYVLEAGFISASLKALVKGIDITGRKTEEIVDTGTLQRTGTILIQLTDVRPRTGDYLYLPGTNSFTVIAARDSAAGQAVLNGVPAGTFNDLAYIAAADSQNTNLLSGTITVPSGDTVALAYAEWKYTRKLFLNTTVSGADVQENVYDFPTLIRLNETTFDFSQTQKSGEDIRFAKSDGSPIAHEIERWDASSGQAEIWVNIDTVFGNDSMQYIAMFWGNAGATGSSNGSAVFNSAEEFSVVWHLGEPFSPILDATMNGFNGTINGNQAQASGYVGFGQYLNGTDGYTEIVNVPNPDTSGITVCAWIRLSALKKRQTIISKSRGGLPSSSYGWLVTLDENGALQAFASSDTGVWGNAHTFVLTSKTVITDTTTWHHVAVIIDRTGNKNCYLFIDGVDVTIPTAAEITTVSAIINTTPVKIGSEGSGGYPWNGLLDECSVSYRVRSTDWVRLCYMNQQKGEKLVVFK